MQFACTFISPRNVEVEINVDDGQIFQSNKINQSSYFLTYFMDGPQACVPEKYHEYEVEH